MTAFVYEVGFAFALYIVRHALSNNDLFDHHIYMYVSLNASIFANNDPLTINTSLIITIYTVVEMHFQNHLSWQFRALENLGQRDL